MSEILALLVALVERANAGTLDIAAARSAMSPVVDALKGLRDAGLAELNALRDESAAVAKPPALVPSIFSPSTRSVEDDFKHLFEDFKDHRDSCVDAVTAVLKCETYRILMAGSAALVASGLSCRREFGDIDLFVFESKHETDLTTWARTLHLRQLIENEIRGFGTVTAKKVYTCFIETGLPPVGDSTRIVTHEVTVAFPDVEKKLIFVSRRRAASDATDTP